jgi:hypothetical protein
MNNTELKDFKESHKNKIGLRIKESDGILYVHASPFTILKDITHLLSNKFLALFN